MCCRTCLWSVRKTFSFKPLLIFFLPLLIKKWFVETDKWSNTRRSTHFRQNLAAWKKGTGGEKGGRKRNLADFSMASAALCTLQPTLLWIWWKVGRNPFQFGHCATVLLKTIDWLNRGTISQYAGADKPSRGETRCLRTERGTLASISPALKLTYNRGGETHTHTHAPTHTIQGQAALREQENERWERIEKWRKMVPVTSFIFSLNSHFSFKKVDRIKENVFLGTGKWCGNKENCLEWKQGVCFCGG